MANVTPNDAFRNPSDALCAPARDHVQKLLSTIQQAKEIHGEIDDTIRAFLDRPFTAIRKDVVDNVVSLETVVRRHIRATISASLQTHCLTAFPWQAAFYRARDFDRELNDEDTDRAELLQSKPLLGLVFSVKDCIHVAKYPTTLGCSSRVDAVPARSAWIVSRLEDLGAIMIAKTACPQAMVSNTTASPLWGMVRSPYGEDYQVGGSSGGEAALVKLHGSTIGIGTDMGGSVRQPATLNELVGIKFKSTDFRFTQPEDFATGLPHTLVPASTCGLLGRDLESVTAVIDALGLYGSETQTGDESRLGRSWFHASSEVREAIRYATKDVETEEVRLIDDNVQQWREAWMDTACAHGFEEGLKMVGSDPLIPTSLFGTDWPRHEPEAALSRTYELRQTFAGHLRERRVNLLVIPGFSYGVPVANNVFFEEPDLELWLQTINLVDWVAMSVPISVPIQVRRRWADSASEDGEEKTSTSTVQEVWLQRHKEISKPLPSDQLPRISIQLVAPPGSERLMLSFAADLVRETTAST